MRQKRLRSQVRQRPEFRKPIFSAQESSFSLRSPIDQCRAGGRDSQVEKTNDRVRTFTRGVDLAFAAIGETGRPAII